MTAQGSLPTLVDVVVLVNGRIIAEKDELVGVPTISECGSRTLAEVLLRRGEPSFRSFPGGKVAVELVGAERAITASEDHIGLSKSSVEPGLGRGGTTAIVAIRDETSREVTVG